MINKKVEYLCDREIQNKHMKNLITLVSDN